MPNLDPSPPHNLEAETAVLGAILRDPTTLPVALDALTPDDFYRTSNQVIFRAMQELFAKGAPVEVLGLADHLNAAGRLEQAGGPAKISMLPDEVATSANIEHHSRLVKNKSTLRRVIHTATAIISTAQDGPENLEEFLDEIEHKIFQIAGNGNRPSYQKLRTVIGGVLDSLERIEGDQGAVLSGFHELDGLTGGFRPGNLIILAGRPKMGKTSLALNIARHAAIEQGKAVAIFSMEMTSSELGLRLLSSESKIESRYLKKSDLTKDDWTKVIQAAEKLRAAKIFIDDSGSLTILNIRSRARRIGTEVGGLDLVIVDYLQQCAVARREVREVEVAEVSRGLKILAKDLNCPVLALSQLNRQLENREEKTPRLSDLRESGALEQDADVVIFIHRPGLFTRGGDGSLAELSIGKQRNGPSGGTIKLKFIEQLCQFG